MNDSVLQLFLPGFLVFVGVLMILFARARRGGGGGGEGDLRPRVEALERKLDQLLAQPAAAPAASTHVGPSDSIKAHILAGRKINAIKEYREQTGVGLREAKDAVEEIARRLGVP